MRKLGDPFFRNGLLSIEGEEWRRYHKIVSSALHVNILETFVEVFAKNSDILANKLKVLADGITAHDISPYFIRCTLDIIVQTSSRIDINAQSGNDDYTLNNFTIILDMIAVRLFKPGNTARDNKKTMVIARHLQLAIRNDEELN